MKILAVSPHIHSGVTTQKLMRNVLIALLPALLAAFIFWRWMAFCLVLTCILSAVLAELLAIKIFKKKNTINNLSAVVTGVLLAFCLPPGLPLWMAAFGAFFAIFIVKELFGGLGYNIFNPALSGRALLLASYPTFMTTWLSPYDALTSATPLDIAKVGGFISITSASTQSAPLAVAVPYWDMFLGTISGALGETSTLALLIGAVYLLCCKVIDWRIPLGYLGTVAVFMFVMGQNVLFHLLAGGLILGAFFMATDYTTSPMSRRGKLIFAIGCGILTAVIRLWGGSAEGTCYAILVMNMFVPLIDRLNEAKNKA